MALPNCVRCKVQLDCFTPFERGRCANCGLEYDELTTIANDLQAALRRLLYLHHGVSKDGSANVTDNEWRAAIGAGKAAIAGARGEEKVEGKQ